MMQQNPSSGLFRSESMGQSLSVYLPATLLSRMIGLARGLLLAWLMAQEQWGLLQIALLVVNVLNPLCSVGLNDAVQRYVPMHETRGTLRRFLRLAVPLVLITGAVLSAVILALGAPLGELMFAALRTEGPAVQGGAAAKLARVGAVAAFGLIAFFLIISTLRGLRMYRALGLIELVGNATFAVLAVAICRAGWNTAWPVVGCYAAAMLAMSALVSMPLRQAITRIEPTGEAVAPESPGRGAPGAFVPRGVVEQMLRFSLWAALAAITWQVLLGYPLWYLNKAAGPRTASVFAGVQLIAQGMLIVMNSIVIVVETAVTKTWESRGRAEADRDLLLAHKATTLFLLAGGAAVTALSPVILRLLPAQYTRGAGILPLLILFFLLAGHLLFLGVHFHLIERTRHLFVPWLLGVLGHVLFSAWWVRPASDPVAAMLAAGWAGVAGMSVALISMLVLVLAERRPMARGNWLLIAAGFSLPAPSPGVPAAIILAALALAALTGWVFDSWEKRHLRESARLAGQNLRRFLAPN